MKLIGKLSKEKQDEFYDSLRSFDKSLNNTYEVNASYETINDIDDFLADQGFEIKLNGRAPSEWVYYYDDGDYISILYSKFIEKWMISLLHKGSANEVNDLINTKRFYNANDLIAYMRSYNEID